MEPIIYLWYALLFGWLFVMGCAVGSFLNVVIYRLPRGKNLLWPSSRCGSCFTPIKLYHNVPLVSYWRLRGRCATCRAPFSMRYFWVEFATGVLVAGLYALEIGLNLQGYSIWPSGGFSYVSAGMFPPHSWPLLVGHGILAALLFASAACLLDAGKIPPSLFICGAIAGLVWSLLYPWPTPTLSRAPFDPAVPGFVPAPVWWPFPAGWEGSLLLGLASALVGLLLVPWLVRFVGRLTRRDLDPAAGLLLMTGGFLGWQPLLAAVALACVLTPLAVVLARGRSMPNPFTFSLIPALVGVWLGWRWLGPVVLPWLFDPLIALVALPGVAALVAVMSRLVPRQGGRLGGQPFTRSPHTTGVPAHSDGTR